MRSEGLNDCITQEDKEMVGFNKFFNKLQDKFEVSRDIIRIILTDHIDCEKKFIFNKTS